MADGYLTFGALAPPLHEQLNREEAEVQLYQRCADALALLRIHSVITNGESHRATHRLIKKMEKELP